MYELTQAEKHMLLFRRKIHYNVIKDGDIDLGRPTDRIKVIPKEQYGVCWCNGNNGAKIQGGICLHCGSDVTYRCHCVTSKEMVTKLKVAFENSGRQRWYAADSTNQVSLSSFFYVKKHPDVDNGLLILKIQILLKGGKDTIEDETIVWKIMHAIEIIPGGKCRAYKEIRGHEVEIDLFDAMQLNSKIVKESPDIVFENCIGPIDFMLNAKKLNQYTGFMQCFNLVDAPMPRASFFMFYMYLYAQYPAVEFVIKMGYVSLLAKIMRNLSNGYNKEAIRNEAKMLRKIINPEATNGSLALTVPRYIADDLNQKNAPIQDYILWGDVHQMTENGVSKERYMKWTRNVVYNDMRWNLSEIPNVLKYGYDFGEVIKYVEKQYNKHVADKSTYYNNYAHYFNLWRDYLNMCDLMCVEPERFPSDIVGSHDNVVKAFQIAQDEIADRAISKLAEMATAYLPDSQAYKDSDYVIVLPKSVHDIVQEGQNMHNCVGSYVNRIMNKQSLVFFVRTKDDADSSFITAEYKHGKLNQLYYKNNRPVSSTEIIAIASDFCMKLSNSHKFNF